MLILNIISLLEAKGVVSPQQYLINAGISKHSVSRLVNNKTANISYDTLEKLCLVCKCTPDDLFVWVPDAATPDNNDNPLQKLKAKPKLGNPVERIKQLPLKKLQELQEFIDKLERGD